MSNEEMRKEFEAAAESKFKNVDFSICTAERGYIYSVGEYTQPALQTMWWAWQTSRAAIEVELPGMPKAQRSDEEATFSAGGCDMLRQCRKAIESAGLKVKP